LSESGRHGILRDSGRIFKPGPRVSIRTDLKQIFQQWKSDQPGLVEAVENLARQRGEDVYREVFRLLTGRDLEPQQAAHCWHEALLRRSSRSNLEPGHGLLKELLSDYLQGLENVQAEADAAGPAGTSPPDDDCRSHLEKLLAAKRSRHGGRPFGLLLLAIDHYPELRRSFSSAEVEDCLSRLTRLLRGQIRDGDSACRLEEGRFWLILPDANQTLTYAIAERIRGVAEEAEFPGQNSLPGGNLTVSVGLASCPQDGLLTGPLMRAAEERLVLAQAAGNRSLPKKVDRRREPRHKISSRVEVELAGEGGFIPAEVFDISDCGMAIGGDLDLKTGMSLLVHFKAPLWPNPRMVRGVVRQSSLQSRTRRPRYGLEFLRAETNPTPAFPGQTPSLD